MQPAAAMSASDDTYDRLEEEDQLDVQSMAQVVIISSSVAAGVFHAKWWT